MVTSADDGDRDRADEDDELAFDTLKMKRWRLVCFVQNIIDMALKYQLGHCGYHVRKRPLSALPETAAKFGSPGISLRLLPSSSQQARSSAQQWSFLQNYIIYFLDTLIL